MNTSAWLLLFVNTTLVVRLGHMKLWSTVNFTWFKSSIALKFRKTRNERSNGLQDWLLFSISTESRSRANKIFVSVLGLTKTQGGKWCLKGVCHKIFDLHFFHDSNPSRPLMKRLKYLRIRFWFRRDIRSQNSKNLTPQCAAHRGVKILGLDNQKNVLQIFLTW